MYYTYLWLREDGTPYYAGKGKGDRAWDKEHTMHVPPKDRIVIYPAESETDAFEMEIALIWYYGRKDLGTGCLRNLTDGGEGSSNPSKETIRKKSEALKGIPLSEEHRQKLRESNVGKKRTAETCRRIGEKSKGRVNSEETKKKLSLVSKGRKDTPEVRKRKSEAAKLRGISEETRAKINKSIRHPWSEKRRKAYELRWGGKTVKD